MKKDSKIFVAGHRGTLGSALLNELKNDGYENILTKTHAELDLSNQEAVCEFFATEKPEFVFFAAVKLGHLAVKNPADILYENLTMQNNVIHNAYLNGVKKLIFYGSSWMYPQKASNPIKENSLLTSELDYFAEPYAIAKIAGLKLLEHYNLQYGTNFICLSLPNLYGTSADFNFKTAKVLPAILRKIHLAKLLSQMRYKELCADLKVSEFDEAKKILDEVGITQNGVELWGTGKTRREFVHSIDVAKASIFIAQNVNFKDLCGDEKEIKNTHINVGTGVDYTIKEVALMVKKQVGFGGEIYFNASRPDSSMDRLMDISKLNALGFKAQISLEEGIKKMYDYYLAANAGGGGGQP